MTTKSVPCCPDCGSTNIELAMWTTWDPAANEWRRSPSADGPLSRSVFCHDCDAHSEGCDWTEAPVPTEQRWQTGAPPFKESPAGTPSGATAEAGWAAIQSMTPPGVL